MGLPLGNGGGDTSTVIKLVIMTILIMFLVPTLFTLYVPLHETEHDSYNNQIAQLEQSYYLSTGHVVTATTEVWALTGIYTPYQGGDYGITPDGWIYGKRIGDATNELYSPRQYNSNYAGTIGGYTVGYNKADGLYYYESAPSNRIDIVPAITSVEDGEGHTTQHPFPNPIIESNTTVYTEVSMDNEHISSIFFTPSGKTETDKGYYYEYTGYRYAFQPLRPYTAEIGGVQKQVEPQSTSLSLIWYRYTTISGIAGQLTLSGSDTGLSYLDSKDITDNFNASTYSSTFDMTFNNIAMHISIRLDPARIIQGMSPKECFDNGYWTVMISSDAVITSKLNDASYDFNPNNVFNTLIKMFTFRVTEDYDIDGWIGILASLLITMPLYACLIAFALIYPESLILVAILGAIQTISSALSGWDLNPFD